jgi:hypothetical protein
MSGDNNGSGRCRPRRALRPHVRDRRQRRGSGHLVLELPVDNLGRAEVVDCSMHPPSIHPSIPLDDKQKIISILLAAP